MMLYIQKRYSRINQAGVELLGKETGQEYLLYQDRGDVQRSRKSQAEVRSSQRAAHWRESAGSRAQNIWGNEEGNRQLLQGPRDQCQGPAQASSENEQLEEAHRLREPVVLLKYSWVMGPF